MTRQLRFATAGPPVLLAASLAAGCGSNGPGPTNRPPAKPALRLPAAHPLTPAGAAVTIAAPRSGQLVGAKVTVRVRLRGFRLVHEPSHAPRAGVGHLQFSLDGGRFDQPQFSGRAGCAAVRIGLNGRYSIAYHPYISYRGLPPGRHQLLVRLANNDDSPAGAQAVTTFVVHAHGRQTPPAGRCFGKRS